MRPMSVRFGGLGSDVWCQTIADTRSAWVIAPEGEEEGGHAGASGCRGIQAVSGQERASGVRLGNRKILKGISITNLAKAMIGETIERSWRHGKLLFAALDKGKQLTLHFGMTGSLAYFKDLDDDPRHYRLRLDLDNEHHLAFVDQRMFGRVGLTSDPETYVAEAGLGPDALAISKSKKAFAELFGGRRGQVKAALMQYLFRRDSVSGALASQGADRAAGLRNNCNALPRHTKGSRDCDQMCSDNRQLHRVPA